jgi:hypothetical protein
MTTDNSKPPSFTTRNSKEAAHMKPEVISPIDDIRGEVLSATVVVPPIQPDQVPDPFDPAALRLSQDFIAEAGVKRLLTTVPVRRPPKHDFFRVRPEESYRGLFGLIPYGDDKDHYLVTPGMAAELNTECAPYQVYTCINRQGVVFLWPVRLPGSDGKDNEWWRSAHEAAEKATTSWVRLTANKSLGAYDILVAGSHATEPQWPEHPFKELLRIGFRDKLIDRVDHEVVKALRGLA